MKAPISYRKGIPFFYDKSEADFQKDPYERYYDMVIRHLALHLADHLWEDQYPMQTVLDFASNYIDPTQVSHLLEIGCGVGRWIGDLAKQYPDIECWGLDFSYQMLKQAHEFWVKGAEFSVDLASKGFVENLNLKGYQLSNLQFGLANAEDLPFEAHSQDLVLSCFLLDRLDDPGKGLSEMHRVLRPGGRLVSVTPLNFSKAKHWRTFFPPVKLTFLLNQMGFNIIDWQEDMIIKEPLDAQGNAVHWNCIGFVAEKAI